MRRLRSLAIHLVAVMLATAVLAEVPVPLASRVSAPIQVAPEVSWYRIERDGARAGWARFEYAPAEAEIAFLAEVEQGTGPARQVQRSRWVFTPDLALVRFEERLESDGERRSLAGEARAGAVRATFEIPGAAPRTFETPIPEGALPRYAANLVLLEPVNLELGAVYVYRQLAPRSGRFATVTTRVLAGAAPGAFTLETTTDELPGLVVRTEVLPRSKDCPNGAALRSEQTAPGGGSAVVLVRTTEADARGR